jgi:hypothetical protein
MAIVYLASAGAARPDLIITNAAGVRAGISGIVRRAGISLGVDFSVVDPTVVRGSTSGEVSDSATSTKQFYRMRLINFQ